ncbi:DNA repair protein RecO [Marinisporobacter balticus]|uniref:DNA repair protein RecO n=1 Tax=Marinisporobacter balticus TaxID=2018667 RepID=A0A4R2KZB8_9FIRM|nr:DNA repair protein RecO [Marinisporobacter balticus]TCO80031.1 DNA replication and repair protein RecO [Marinisporobacter balticus]
MLLKTDAVVLKQSKFGEGHAVLTLFSKKTGKLQAVNKGYKKSGGKYSVGTQPFCYGEFVLFKGSGLYQISQVDLKDSFYKLRENVIKLTYASYILELTERMVTEGQTNNRLFYTLLQFLHIFSNFHKEYETLIKAYELKLLMYSGYKPEMNNCVHCGNNYKEKIKFSVNEGGILCESCFREDSYAMQISKVTINVMKFLMDTDLEQISKLKIKPNVLKELNKIVKEYIYTYIDKKQFKSLQFLESIKE